VNYTVELEKHTEKKQQKRNKQTKTTRKQPPAPLRTTKIPIQFKKKNTAKHAYQELIRTCLIEIKAIRNI
jgi:hypothetical protein